MLRTTSPFQHNFPWVTKTMNLTRSRIGIHHVVIVIAGLLSAAGALPVCDMILKHGRSQTSRMRIGVNGPFALSWQTTNRQTGWGQQRSFAGATLFAGNNDDKAKLTMGLFTRKRFILASLFLLVPSILVEAYSRFGALSIPEKKNDATREKSTDDKYSSFVPSPKHTEWDKVETVTIVFHGAGGEDAYTDELMKNLEGGTGSTSSPQQSYNHIVNWSGYSANLFQASFNGQKVGRITARELLEQIPSNKLTAIHFIGISVGAFAADAAVNEVKKIFESSNKWKNTKTDTLPFVQLTLLDPFQQRGIFGVGYGNNEFGKSADYAQQYLNTDDPVPSTNKPLKNTVCYDVTNLRPESIFGHDWPLVYYARSHRCGKIEMANQANESKRDMEGSVIVL